MNAELKAQLVVVFGLVKTVQDFVLKKGIAAEVADFEQLILGIPSVISNWSDLSAEVNALLGTEQEADLIAFVISQFGGVTSDAHAKGILSSILAAASHMVADGFAIAAAFKG